MKNWKTTVAGIALVFSTTLPQFGLLSTEKTQAVQGIIAGFGMLLAADSKKTTPTV